jgi:hypothetical protein
MPTLPWTALGSPESGDHYVVVATRFELTGRRHMVKIFSAAQTLMSTFTSTPGLRGYSLRASIVHNSLWTLSAWSTEVEMRRFVRGAAHGTVVSETTQWMRASSFVTWTEPADSRSPDWRKAARLMRENGRNATHPTR